MANSAITLPCYSFSKPFGFPLDPNKWTVKKVDGSRRQQANPSTSTWYNLGTTNCQIVMPIGVWSGFWSASVGASGGNVDTEIAVTGTLSTANNSEISKEYSAGMYCRNIETHVSGTALNAVLGRNIVLTVTSKTTYYLNASVYSVPVQTDLSFNGNEYSTIIKFVCAYL
jgi:hypothetical protein